MRSGRRLLSAFASACLAVALSSSPGSGADVPAARTFPLPATESGAVVRKWLAFEGYAPSKSDAAGGGARIEGVRGDERWTVEIEPSSPLASRVTQRFERAGRPEPSELARLWKHLDRYVSGDASPGAGLSPNSRELPAAVRGRVASVACLSADRAGGGAPIRFSGVSVGRGLILATGHDLEGVQRVRATWGAGKRSAEGRVLRRDAARDLTLIRVKGAAEFPAVPLDEGRDLLSGGEPLYSIGCPTGDAPAVRDGFVSGPPVKSDGQPLWPVEIETLPGSSGGPVFDASGNIAGLVKGRVRGTETRGFVIPVRTLVEFIKGRSE